MVRRCGCRGRLGRRWHWRCRRRTSGDDEEPLTGSSLDRAVDAALEETGGGTVVETEAGDDGAAYSVEVRLDDGSQVEVSLDQDFTVVGQEADDDGPNDDEGESDDD